MPSLTIPYLESHLRGAQPLRRRVKLYYYRYQNAGDMFAPWMMELLFNVKADWRPQGEADMVAVGSILDHFSADREHDIVRPDPIFVWGSGFLRSEPYIMPMIRDMEVLALRGPHSKARLEDTLDRKLDCVLGDPGLLASLLPGLPPVNKDIELGVIPHYQERDNPAFYRAAASSLNSYILNIQLDSPRFLEQLRRCQTVLTSSLHGAIFADAFGIPNRWVVTDSRERWWDNKFYDYYGSYGIDMKPWNIDSSAIPTPDYIIKSYAIKQDEVKRIQEELIRCYPYRMVF